jgi:hypothetical protein
VLRRGETNAPSIAFQVKIPVVHELFADVPPLQSLAVVSLKLQLSFAADVIEVLANRPGGLGALRRIAKLEAWRSQPNERQRVDFLGQPHPWCVSWALLCRHDRDPLNHPAPHHQGLASPQSACSRT